MFYLHSFFIMSTSRVYLHFINVFEKKKKMKTIHEFIQLVSLDSTRRSSIQPNRRFPRHFVCFVFALCATTFTMCTHRHFLLHFDRFLFLSVRLRFDVFARYSLGRPYVRIDDTWSEVRRYAYDIVWSNQFVYSLSRLSSFQNIFRLLLLSSPLILSAT